MTIKPIRPDMDYIRNNAQIAEETGNYMDINSGCVIWLLNMLEEAKDIVEFYSENPDVGPEGMMLTWMRKYRGEDNDNQTCKT